MARATAVTLLCLALVSVAALVGDAAAGTVTPGRSNWGGDAALIAPAYPTRKFLSTTATFVVPMLDCSSTVGRHGTLLQIWSGLDGAYPAFPVSIEQVGVDTGCSDGEQESPTFYSMQFDRLGQTKYYAGE